MIRRLGSWFDHRTGYRKLVSALLVERIPGGPRWRYVWGSCLAFVFFIQLITGVLLMTAYSPGDTTAWASVYFIQYEMDFGWLIRGLHHFGSQAMVVLLAIHVLQVVIAGAHLPPREVNWWVGLALAVGVLGLSLTGYLLPWDQKGYWATQVATKIAGNVPVFGQWLEKSIVGGPRYGHHTLTRFYTLHVWVLPLVMIMLIILHLALFRRHGVTAPRTSGQHGWFWPDQAFRDAVMSLLIFFILFGITVYGTGYPIDQPFETGSGEIGEGEPRPLTLWEHCALAGRNGSGAQLDGPADPSRPYPARPEWYFLAFFELLKKFEGDQEVVGTVYIPAAVAAALFILPLLGYGWMRRFGHAVGVLVVAGLLYSSVHLTVEALIQDRRNASLQDEFSEARESARRAIQIAAAGIPLGGPVELLRRDPKTQGQALFGKYCASCHNYGTIFTSGDKASDLEGFGSSRWIRSLLQNPLDPKYFGNTELTRMAEWVSENLQDLSPEDQKELDVVVDWLAGHPRDTSPDADGEPFRRGLDAFEYKFDCMQCHSYEGLGGTTRGPDFTGYGSAEWIRGMIMSPDHRRRYGKDNAMPTFLDLSGPDGDLVARESAGRTPSTSHLLNVDRELIIRWLTQDDRPVYGGEPIWTPATD